MLPASEKNLRSFGLLMAGALLALLGLHLWKGNPAHRAVLLPALAVLSPAFAGLAILAPRALSPIYKPWMAMAHCMGLVMTTVLMTLFFFTVLVPFTLIRFKDPLRMKLGSSTYWEPRKNPEPTLERYHRPF
jgi:hypothetical protein